MSEISDMLDRIVAMQKEAVTGCDSVPFWPYQQESFPYFTNRLGSTTIGDRQAGSGAAEDIEARLYSVSMQFVVGHITSGYEGERQDELYDWVELIQDFFMENPMLTSTAFPTEPDFLLYEAELTGHTGLIVISNAGLSTQQLSVLFTLTVPFVAKAY